MRRRPLPPVREDVPAKSWRKLCENDLAMYFLLATVGVLSYANSLHGDFVHDDIPAIVTNGDVNGANPVLDVFTNDFWGTPMKDPNSHKSYRPLTTLTFRLNHLLCGPSPSGWHATNVCLHAACCVLVARVALLARLNRPFAAVAAILFAVHPVHTEAVSGMVGRADVLACLFFLTSVLLYHGSRQHVWGSVGAAALSTLAKETGLTALVFNLAFDLYRSWPPHHTWSWRGWRGCGPGVRRGARAAAALLALAAVRLALLHGALPAFSAMDNPAAFHSSFVVRVLTFSYLAALNWWMLLCPVWLSHDWQLGAVPLVHSACDARNLLTGAALATSLALLYRCLADKEAQRHTPAVWGVLLLVIPYLPASNLLVTVGFVLAERVLYIPSVGSVLLTAYGIQLLWQRGQHRRLLLAAILVLIAAMAARTQSRNRDWRTRETLLRADLRVLPHNAKLHYNFANFLKDTDQKDQAIRHYKEALRLWPTYASAHNNLGTLVSDARAEQHFLLALRYHRHHLNAHYNLGKLYRKTKRFTESLSMLERCVSLAPRFVPAYLELLQLRRVSERQTLLDQLLRLEPRNWEHRLLYGHWYRDRGLQPLALQQYSTALALALRDGGGVHSGAAAVRAIALMLRSTGQWTRLLQVVTRWQSSLGGASAARRAAAHSAWRLRAELRGRAARYDIPQGRHVQPKSTCVHHSQLEVASHKRATTERTTVYAVSDSDRKTDSDSECHKHNKLVKKVSIPTQYKVPVNKSETGHKRKSCPLHTKKKIKDQTFPQLGTDHYNIIHTY